MNFRKKLSQGKVLANKSVRLVLIFLGGLFLSTSKAQDTSSFTDYNTEKYSILKKFDTVSETHYFLTRIKHKDRGGELIKLKHAHSNSDEGETVKDFATRLNSMLAFNASTQSLTKDGKRTATGVQIIDSVIVQDKKTTAYILGVKANNELVVYPPGTEAEEILADGCTNALTAFMPLISNYTPVTKDVLAIRGNSFKKHPRQVIAQMENLDLIFLSCGGRGYDGQGMTVMDVIRILQKEGVKFAYNLDGGGSTSTVVGHRLITKKIDKHGTEERLRPNVLYFK